MRRETTNRIRTVLEDWLPPAVRDGALFRALARAAWGAHIERLAQFRERAAFISAEEYEALYRAHPRVHEGTDNSEGCIRAISEALTGRSICDVGCGTGELLRRLATARPDIEQRVGTDLLPVEGTDGAAWNFITAPAETLPFDNGAFDTMVCTHLIEHLLEPRRAIAELRRVARRRIIVVVPLEREYRYTFNPHLNFFPYMGSFLRLMVPVPRAHECRLIGRDIFYHEDREP